MSPLHREPANRETSLEQRVAHESLAAPRDRAFIGEWGENVKQKEGVVFRSDNTAGVGIKAFGDISRNPGLAALGRGDDMEKQLRMRPA